MWNTFSVQKNLNKNFFLTFDQELRLRENFSRLNLLYTNFGMGYKFKKGFKAELTYRTIQKFQTENVFSFRHRLMLDIAYKKKFSKIIFSNRLRYQTEVRDYLISQSGQYPEHFLRYKVEMKLDLNKKITPYVSVEARYQIDVPRGKQAQYNGEIHRVRYAAGFDYKINDRNSFGVYYLIQREFYLSSPENNYILGLQYALSL